MPFDLRLAFRQLAKSPGFTAVALITLALGIGANTTAFSVLNALLLHTPPYPNPEMLVRVYRTSSRGQSGAHSPANFLDYRSQNQAFSHISAIRFTDLNLGEAGQPTDRIRGMSVTADFFPLLGVAPQIGRTFNAEEDQPGADAVVVLSHRAWKQRFAGDPSVIGRTLRVDGAAATVVGVMPEAFDDYQLWGRVDAWRPMALPDMTRADRENAYLRVIGRLKPGVSPEQAHTAMAALSAQLAQSYPATNTDLGVRLESLARSAQDDAGRRITWLVAGLAGFVLLIACANLANLQFARNAARGRDHAIRAALGATRGQLMRLVLTESLLLSLGGAAAGFLLAQWTNGFVAGSFTFGEHVGLDLPIDWRVLAFTAAISILTGIGFGLLPAWLAARANVGDALKQGGRGATTGRAQHRLRHALIVAEIALALILLTGAGYFVRGLQRIVQRDAGWRTDDLATASLSLRGQKYTTAEARGAFYRQLHERLSALPGVSHVAIATSIPLGGYDTNSSFVVEGLPPPARAPVADVAAVSPGYFATLGIRLLQGRDFTADDRAGNRAVVVINETMARQFWPGENPVGKRIGGATPFMENPREIIGVVSDVRASGSLDDRAGRFQFYRSLAQWSGNSATIVLRSNHAAEAVAQDLRRTLVQLDPDQAVYRVTTVRQEIESRLASVDIAGRTMTGFALLGLMLAAVGIYGVVANSVVQRTNEIGVRMALGAQVRDILALILGGGLRLTFLGAGIGLVGALGITRLLRALSPDFSATDVPLTVAITAVLIVISMLACWLPARRAARISPMAALRAE